MRIPIPERFTYKQILIFTVLLAVGLGIVHTDLTFTLLAALYTFLFGWAFNQGGGLTFLAGAYIFFNGTQTALIGLVYKVLIGEPGERNLLDANTTMLAYCVGMAAMGLAAFFSRRFLPRSPLLDSMSSGPRMKQAAIGCLVLGIAFQIFSGNKASNGSVGSALSQVNHFNQMAIILGTTYAINRSGGKSSSNWIVWAAGTWIFLGGLVSFSKEGMFTPLTTWLLPAATLGYNFSKKQILIGAAGLFLVVYFLVPYSQYGRKLRTESGEANVAGSLALLTHPLETRALYLEEQEQENDHGGPHFYDTPQGFMDREQSLAVDDFLIEYTDQGNVRGLEPLVQAFGNVIPHFIWKNKPVPFTGNEYARESGMIPAEDDTTGISLSPTADAYHEATWFGMTVVMPLLMFATFLVCDSIAGDTRKSPWGLLLVALSAHVAAEGLLGGAVFLMTFGVFAVVLIALISKHVLPIVVNLFTGNQRADVERTGDAGVRPLGSRLNPLLRSAEGEPPAL